MYIIVLAPLDGILGKLFFSSTLRFVAAIKHEVLYSMKHEHSKLVFDTTILWCDHANGGQGWGNYWMFSLLEVDEITRVDLLLHATK